MLNLITNNIKSKEYQPLGFNYQLKLNVGLITYNVHVSLFTKLTVHQYLIKTELFLKITYNKNDETK